MRRFLFLTLAFVLSASCPFLTQGQDLRDLIEDDGSAQDSIPPQRIAVPQSQFNLSENESGSVTGYCFDEYLIAPRRVTRFEKVLANNDDAIVRTANGKTMTLRDAIASGAVGVRAMQLQVTFTNKSGEPMAIELRRPVVLWDRPGGHVNEQALKVLESPRGDYDSRQQAIWRYTSAERLLGVLGYYDGSVWNIDRNRMQKATEQYQRANDLAATGEIDEATARHVAATSGVLRERLRGAGFYDTERRSVREDLAAQIRNFEGYLGQKRDGRWSSDLGEQLASSENLAIDLNKLRSESGAADKVLADEGRYPGVLTYLNGLKGFMALVETPRGVELWSRRGGTFTFEGRGADAINRIDDMAASMARKASKDDRVVLYPRVSNNGLMTVTLGNRVIYVDGKELDNYMRGGEMPASLATAVASMAGGSEMTGDKAGDNVILYRSPLVQGRMAKAGTLKKLGLSQADGAQLASALDATYGDRMALYVSDDLRGGASRLRDPKAATQGEL